MIFIIALIVAAGAAEMMIDSPAAAVLAAMSLAVMTFYVHIVLEYGRENY